MSSVLYCPECGSSDVDTEHNVSELEARCNGCGHVCDLTDLDTIRDRMERDVPSLDDAPRRTRTSTRTRSRPPVALEERYGLYAYTAGGKLERLATAPDGGGIGVAITALDEDEREARGAEASLGDRGVLGVRDRVERRWIISPFPESPTV